MDKRLAAAERAGKEAFELIPVRLDELDVALQQHFALSVDKFREAARAAAQPRMSNRALLGVQYEVHNLLGRAVSDFRALEFWLVTKVPQVSDGNNFGVEVQHYVIDELKKCRIAMQGHADSLANYSWSRGLGAEKMGSSSSSEENKSEVREEKTEDGTPKVNTTMKTEKTDKTVSKPEIEDFGEHIVALDVKHYVALEGMLREVEHAYVRTFELIKKNRDKCENPRGDSTSGSRPFNMY
mmetsp:Transcript_22943/g.59002  ORF Transcript_22943/g.59002 Transcript_22943/m.59002 type:complete len:240 (-) Transcript_22943:208-927(-)